MDEEGPSEEEIEGRVSLHLGCWRYISPGNVEESGTFSL